MIEVDVFEILAEEICGQCSYRQHIITSCYDECPFQKHFAELRAKCEDIYKDADYLADLAADEDSWDFDYPHNNYNPYEDGMFLAKQETERRMEALA